MNRIKLELIKQNTNVEIKQIQEILGCTPYGKGWMSEKFPIYPIFINLYIANPPFNRISMSLSPKFLPSVISIYGSADSRDYFKIREIRDYREWMPDNIVINLEENHHYKYLRLKIEQPPETKDNICRQIYIRCIQLTQLSFFGAQYACSMKSALTYDPYLFRMLEILEYKALLSKKRDKQLSAKHYDKIQKLFQRIKQKKQNSAKLSEQMREKLLEEIKQIIDQPIDSFYGQQIQYDRQAIRQEVKMLQGELADFYTHRLNSLHKDVVDYFEKYWNVEIKEQYLRLLSSPEREDHNKALTNFWAQVKQLENYPPNLEEAIVMFFNYFLQYVHDPLKITAIMIMCLFFRNPSLSFKIYYVYERVLFNLYSQLSDPQNQELFKTAIKCIYTLYQKVPDNLYLQALLNPQNSVKTSMKITKLQILEKLTFRAITIENKEPVFQFLYDLLLIKELSLPIKNKVYNVIAYLASLIGKQAVMIRFEKLNTMITMPMEKIIDKKLEMIRKPKKEEEIPSCEHCGITRQAFQDPNVLDLHHFKQCKYLTSCKYCASIVQIPELFKHYIHDCKQRNNFKQCENCNETILKANEEEHNKTCNKMLATKCPLCYQKMAGKLKLNEHILKDGCPNNSRK